MLCTVSPLLSCSRCLSLSLSFSGCVHVSIAYIVVLRTVLSLKLQGRLSALNPWSKPEKTLDSLPANRYYILDEKSTVLDGN